MRYYHLAIVSFIVYLIQWTTQSVFQISLPKTIRILIVILQGICLFTYLLALTIQMLVIIKRQSKPHMPVVHQHKKPRI